MSQTGSDRGTEYTKWAASRPGVPGDPSRRQRFRNPLQQPVLTLLGILAFAVLVGGGAYAMFGAGGPPVSADHERVAGMLDLDATICCIEYQVIGDQQYLFVTVLERPGFFRTGTPREVTLRILAVNAGDIAEIASLRAPIDSHLPRSMAMVDTTLFAPLGVSEDDPSGLWVVDVSDPGEPVEIGIEQPDAFIRSVTSDGDSGLVSHTRGAFQFFDATDPESPERVGELRQPVGAVQRAIVEGDHLYHREIGSDRIRILDISDLDAPGPVGRYSNADATGSAPLRTGSVIDSAGERLEMTAPVRRIQDFTVAGDMLYVVASDLGLEIVDISDPASPDTLDRIQLDGRAVRTAVAGDSLYVVTVDEESRERLAYEVHAFDLDDPAEPEHRLAIDTIRAAPGRQAIETSGGYVFLGLNDTVVMLDTD